MGKRVVGDIIVVEVRLNVNLMALTIEQGTHPTASPVMPSRASFFLTPFVATHPWALVAEQ